MKPNTDTIQVPTSQEAELQNAVNLEVETDKVRTPGWKLFDFIAHGVIGWGLNIILSLGVVHDQWNYKRNQAIKKYEETNGKEGLQGEKRRLAIGWFHKMTEWVDKYSEKGWAAVLPGKGKENDKFADTREQAQEITTGFFTLSGAGHLTTAISQVMETPRIKRKLVRWLDKHVTDPYRKAMGKGPSEAELKERQAIYHKLDNELSGKSAMGMIGSRLFGIAAVIGLTTALGAADRALVKPQSNVTPEQDKENRGFGRVPQAFFWATKKMRPNAKMLKPAQEDQFTDGGRTYAQYMARMTALEFAGATTTATTQYLYLMAKEFFGFGVDTNVKKGKKTEQPAPTVVRKETKAPAVEQRTAVKEEKKTNYREKNKPAGETHQDKALATTNEPVMEAAL